MATCFTISLMFLLMTADVGGQQDWGVNYNPSYVCASRGSTVRMSCIYPPDQWIKSVHWTKTTRVASVVSPNLCYNIYQCQTYSIILTRVTEADKGVYYCIFTSGISRVWRGTPGVELDVTDLQVETQQRVKEGDSVTLTCKTTCRLTEETTFIWYRNGQRLTEGRLTVNLPSVRRHDSGLYRCALREYGHQSSAGVYLGVEYVDGQQDWGVNYNPSYVCALRGSIVRMSCDLKYPPDHVVNKTFWTKAVVPDTASPDLCLNSEDRRVQCHNEDKDSYSITLTNVTEADKHVYYCRFITDRPDGVWTGVPGVQLDVTDLQVETQQRVKEGDSVTLTCKTTCRLTEETTFIWYRNTQTLTEHAVNEFHLQSVSHHDSGLYRCAIRGSDHLSSPGVNLLVENVGGQKDWGVNYNPSYVCALRGSTVRMSCDSKYPPGHVVNNAFWTKAVYTGEENPNLCLKPTDRRRDCQSENKDSHSVKKDSHSITLTNVTEADKHVYYCRFTTNKQGGKWTGVPGAQLDVTDLQVETQQRVKEGDSVTLTCKTTCRLTEETTFIWYRNTQTLTEHTVNEFHLQSVSRHDSGLYRCAIRGHEHLSSPGVYLNVEYSPENTSASISPSGVIVEGDSLTLTCSSESNPPVHIYSWFKGEKFVGSGNIFRISNITSDHSGDYKCKAKNKRGDKYSEAVKLNVMYAPRNVSVSISSSGVIVEGDSVNLTCSSESNPPVLIYSWFKEEKFVGSGNIYRISNIRSDHSGEYKCKTSNNHGVKYSEAVILNVMYAPRDVSVSISSSGVIVEGDSVTLTCSSESNPPVLIYSWFKENQTSSVGSGQTFSITNINSSLSGWFYCVAHNKHGSQRSAAISLSVKGVQSSAVVSGIVAGCGGLFFIIVFIILFIWIKRKDGGSEVNSQNQDNHFSGSAGAASANDVPLYSVVSANQREASVSADADDVQYASVHHIRNKEISEKEQEECQYMNFKLNPTSDPDSDKRQTCTSHKGGKEKDNFKNKENAGASLVFQQLTSFHQMYQIGLKRRRKTGTWIF
ncbi:Hemicentin-1 Fibulin-6 [Triplophysa tibetana]|uniref:Hemicentin-1 Fibulin-6 n=1 Tax=Triplophysa tibetana TaxID=1572043 RepID=A0A5A9PLD6_9TELE|nr:Hemicentin-1 Fibulin-6 [Triplophysa tibetana]